MKKKAYKTPAGGAFRTYFHGNKKTNGCTFRKVPKEKEEQHHGTLYWLLFPPPRFSLCCRQSEGRRSR